MKKITLLLIFLISTLGYAQPGSAAPTPPARDAGDVVSVFSDAYTDIAVSEFSTVWDNADVFDDTAGGDAVKRYTLTGGAFIGIQLTSTNDISTMENFHVDIWVDMIDAGDVILPKLANFANGTGNPTSNEIEYTYAFAPTEAGTWVSIDVALSSFNIVSGGSNAVADLFQIVFGSSGTLAGATLYMDNLYFWRPSVDPNTDASLSDLQVDGMTVAGFAPGTLSYDVELPNGTTMVPTVTGTATQAGMGSSNVSVTPAAGIPGTTMVLVTAPNGTDTETYMVNFTEAPALPPAAPTPPSIPAISILSDVFVNVGVPQVDVFGGVLTNYDLNTDGNEEARSLVGGSGFQFNFFAGTFLDVSAAGMLHLDIYNDDFQASDVLTIRLIGSDNRQNIHRITGFDPADNGTWVSIDLQLPNGDPSSTDRGDFDEPDSDANSVDLSSLGLIQFNTLENGSSLGSREFFLSNFYFFGGTLSTPDLTQGSFKVFPNPTNSSWNIITNNTTLTSVEVYDILGKRVKSVQVNTESTVIDASDLNDGIYIARISSDSGSKTIKLVKN